MESKTQESIITSEGQYIDTLSDVAKTAGTTNFDLITPDAKAAIDAKEAEINTYLASTVITDDGRDEIVGAAIELWNQYKDIVKNALCNFTLNGLEIRTVDKKLHSSVDYNTETLFYGLHLKKHFIDTLPKVKSDFEAHNLTITFSNAIALYHVLSTIIVRGLNKENYAFAHLLYKLSEISKVYQHYDAASARLNKTIGHWTMGINAAQATELQNAVAEAVHTDAEVNAALVPDPNTLATQAPAEPQDASDANTPEDVQPTQAGEPAVTVVTDEQPVVPVS